MSYVQELPVKKYVPNVVIKIGPDYFTIRQPDSGLSGPNVINGVVSSVTLNPTSIDPLRPASVISQSSFKLLDKNGVVTARFDALLGLNLYLQGEAVDIYLGRSNVAMDFADYYLVPKTYISKVSKLDNAYSFTTKDAKDRLSTGSFSLQNKLAVDILAATTIITLQSTDGFTTSGTVRLNDEIFTYTGISGSNLTGCVRGGFGSTAVDHSAGDDLFLVEVVEDNPITILLQLLISAGGGGIYDVLTDGAAIDETLIDIAEFESVRDSFYPTDVFRFFLGDIDALRTFIESEILFPLGLRLRTNNNGKIGLAVLSAPTLNIDGVTIDHNQMTDEPGWSVDDTKVINRVILQWDFSDATQKFQKILEIEDDGSIAEYGPRNPLKLRFKGIKESLGGAAIADRVASYFLARFAEPRPVVNVATQFSASAWLLGERPQVESTLIPTTNGDLNFADSLEVLQKSINYETGDVRYQLSYTQFTGVRTCFLAPCETIVASPNPSTIELGAGRGDDFRVGWVMRLRTPSGGSAENRVISGISGDIITFSAPWVTPIVPTETKIVFPDYSDATEQQRKYCYLAPCDNEPFPDGQTPYQVTYC